MKSDSLEQAPMTDQEITERIRQRFLVENPMSLNEVIGIFLEELPDAQLLSSATLCKFAEHTWANWIEFCRWRNAAEACSHLYPAATQQ
jgi:hypothetical protein